MKTTRRHFFLSPAFALAAGSLDAQKSQASARWMPKLSENLADVNPPTLRWLKQIGCNHVIFQGTDEVDMGQKGYWTLDEVLRVTQEV